MLIKYQVIPGFDNYGITHEGTIYRLDKMRELKGRVIALSQNGKPTWFWRAKLVKNFLSGNVTKMRHKLDK